MKNRNSILLGPGRALLLAHELCQPIPPQTQTAKKKSFFLRWLFAVAFLSLCALAAHGQSLPPVPPTPTGSEYSANYESVDDGLYQNVRYAYCNYYDPESICDAAYTRSFAQCSHHAYPFPHAYAPVEYWTLAECQEAQFDYFQVYAGSKGKCKLEVDDDLPHIISTGCSVNGTTPVTIPPYTVPDTPF